MGFSSIIISAASSSRRNCASGIGVAVSTKFFAVHPVAARSGFWDVTCNICRRRRGGPVVIAAIACLAKFVSMGDARAASPGEVADPASIAAAIGSVGTAQAPASDAVTDAKSPISGCGPSGSLSTNKTNCLSQII
jgi:hypothetical protein